MDYVAGIDLGGTAINYTIADRSGRFLIDALFERPARAVEGPLVCLDQIAEGIAPAVTDSPKPECEVRLLRAQTTDLRPRPVENTSDPITSDPRSGHASPDYVR